MANLRQRPAQPKNRENLAAIERRVLGALCGGSIARAKWNRIVGGLREYRWLEPEHQVVFEALTRIRSNDPKTLQARLPAQTTRMGFPDVDWKIYLSGAEAPVPEIERLVRKLRAELETPA